METHEQKILFLTEKVSVTVRFLSSRQLTFKCFSMVHERIQGVSKSTVNPSQHEICMKTNSDPLFKNQNCMRKNVEPLSINFNLHGTNSGQILALCDYHIYSYTTSLPRCDCSCMKSVNITQHYRKNQAASASIDKKAIKTAVQLSLEM